VTQTIEHTPTITPAPTELGKAGEVLMQAAEIIRLVGWGQWPGQDHYQGPERCLMTAINGTRWFGDGVGEGAILKARDQVVRSLGFSCDQEAIDWNDTPGRTKEEVIEALERAAYGV
jgi:hypothetical protein